MMSIGGGAHSSGKRERERGEETNKTSELKIWILFKKRASSVSPITEDLQNVKEEVDDVQVKVERR